MRQFLLPPAWGGGRSVTVTGKDARRLVSVLRLRPGDSFPAMAPDGRRFSCTVVSAGPAGLVADLCPSMESPPEGVPLPDLRSGSRPEARQAVPDRVPATTDAARPALPRIVLAVGLLKGSKLDEVARAAAEAGVSAIVPLRTERTVPSGDPAARVARLGRIVAEALGQSGSPVATRVLEPAGLGDLVREWPAREGRLLVVFHESPLAEMSLHRYCSSEPDEIVACIGPEGGFSAAELELLAGHGFRPAWLGPNVLRAETAAIFALASLRIVCLERPSWSTTKYNG